ncbi:pseudouridine synthase [Xylaria nigripes]|nr:pseudouridine synthase [Xylaria nigripes]
MATHTAMAQGSNPSMRDSLERNLGIIHFASTKGHSWSGQSRTRYTDFQVNELTKNGEVVHLGDFYNNSRELAGAASQKNITSPENLTPSQHEKLKSTIGDNNTTVKDQEQNAEGKARTEAEQQSKDSILESDKATLVDLLGQTTTNELIDFYAKILKTPKAAPKSHGDISIPPIADKTQRSRVHGEIRRIFGDKIETTTASDGSIKATAARGTSGQRGDRSTNRGSRNDRRNPTQGDVGPYLHFSLYKENKDTMDALSHMAKTLRIHPKAFGAAGTKDRRAVTVQRVSVKGRTPASLIFINERINNVKIGDFKYAQDPIRLNDHDGNEFVIVLKNCVFSGTEDLDFEEKLKVATSTIDSAINQLSQHGFINYYGTQRFGTHQIGTHEVGMKILKEDFAGAVQALLSYDPLLLQDSQDQSNAGGPNREDINRARACSIFLETKNSKAALDCLPPRCHVEKTLIQHLGRNSKDFVGALTSINRSMRTMYGHAYQSLVWNFVASKRWEQFGAQVIKGDLVLVKSATTQSTNDDERDVESSMAWEEDVTAAQDYGLVPHVVTEDEIQSRKYSIFDVVLPSPGWDVIYPPNDIGDFYAKFMGKPEYGGLDPYNMRRLQRDFSLPGSYRKLMGKLKRTPTASVQAYSNDLEQLVPTDLDIIRSRRAKEAAERDIRQRKTASAWNSFAQDVQQNEIEESKARAARRKAEAPTPLVSINDTWIQTSVDGSNKRIRIAKHSSVDIVEPSFVSPVERDAMKLSDNTPGERSAETGGIDQEMETDAVPEDEPTHNDFGSSIITAVESQVTNNEIQAVSNNLPPQTGLVGGEAATTVDNSTTTPQTTSSPSPQKIAVILRFVLDTSQYATIVVRELQGAYTPKNALT